jgi:hypothetical protein
MKAKDYPEHEAIIVAVTRPYYIKIWTCDPFPDDRLRTQWAMDSWDVVSDGVPVPGHAVVNYLTKRDSNARTLLKESVRALVKVHYPFKIGGEAGAVPSNVKLVKSLLTGAAFHSKVSRPHSNNMSLTSDTHFSHLSQIEFCLDEWKTGVSVNQKLHEPNLKEKYSGHLKDVIKWDGLAPDVTQRIRRKFFDDLRYVRRCPRPSDLASHPFYSASTGPVDTRGPGTSHVSDTMLEKAAAGLAARTGDSDAESDDPDVSRALEYQ